VPARCRVISTAMVVLILAAGCGQAQPTSTSVPPTVAPVAPTASPVPPSPTPLPPTATPAPATPTTHRQPTGDSGERILFIGNSHTFMNDLPGTFAALARSGGREVDVDSSANGGYTLEQHARDRQTQEKLEGGGWDFVVLQESTQVLTVESTRNTQMAPAVSALEEKARSQGGQTVLVVMWASTSAVDEAGLAGFAADQAEVTAALQRMTQGLDVLLAPVGPAWERSLRQRPELDLWGSDNHHASPTGTYLMACVLYATIYEQSPVGLSFTAGLPEETALGLQEIAEEATEGAPTLTPTPTPPAAPSPSAPPAEGGRGGKIAFYSTRDGNSEIYIMNADGSDLTRLTSDSAGDLGPAISPDGSRIAFTSDRDGNQELYLMNVDGSQVARLTHHAAYDSHAAWSPDGQKIAFTSERDGNGEIYLMNVDGTDPRRLTEDPAEDMRPSWSPDGTRIAFSRMQDENWDLYVMDADGSNLQRLTASESGEVFPAWSPDGSQIAYMSSVQRGSVEIRLMDADGSNDRPLPGIGRVNEDPAWSPDGTEIVFQSDRDGNWEIYVMDADGGNQRRLTDDPAGDYWPSWGPAVTQRAGRVLFAKSEQTFASIPTWKVGLADLDGDGDLDAVFANGQANDSEVWLNDGSGFFTDTGQQLGKYGHGIDVGDLDGDGDPDLIISTHRDSAPSRVYLNDGHAVFQELEGAFEVNIGYSVDLLDIDGDGDLDAAGGAVEAAHVYLNDGTGRFSASEISTPPTNVWGDLDSDGDVDLVIKEENVGYSVRLNDGTGNLSQHWSHPDPEAMDLGDMALGDLDGDGDLDLVITNGHFQSTSHPALVFVNDGTGRFADSGQRLSAVRNGGVGLGDLDGDGDLDLVLADYMEPCQIWLNDGGGGFRDSGFRFGDDQLYRHVHLGDLDGDGDLDVLLATFGTNQGPNEIWFNSANSGN
jgi:Tol biopolymer transport system component